MVQGLFPVPTGVTSEWKKKKGNTRPLMSSLCLMICLFLEVSGDEEYLGVICNPRFVLFSFSFSFLLGLMPSVMEGRGLDVAVKSRADR